MKKILSLVLTIVLCASIASNITVYADTETNPFQNPVYGYYYELSDVSLVLKHIAGWGIEIDTQFSDANWDGKINLSDVSFMLKRIAGWRV